MSVGEAPSGKRLEDVLDKMTTELCRYDQSLATANARIAELEAALRLAERALHPFADKVYNDNGDMSVGDSYNLKYEDFTDAYCASRRARAVLKAGK